PGYGEQLPAGRIEERILPVTGGGAIGIVGSEPHRGERIDERCRNRCERGGVLRHVGRRGRVGGRRLVSRYPGTQCWIEFEELRWRVESRALSRSREPAGEGEGEA